MTTEGKRYYIEALRVLDAIDEAESVVRRKRAP